MIMADELMIDGSPWWRNVNMAKIKEARHLSQQYQQATSRPVMSPPIATTSAPVSVPVAKSHVSPPAVVVSTSSSVPVAPLSFVPQRRETLPFEDSIVSAEYPDADNPTPPKWYSNIKREQLQSIRVPAGVEEHLNKIHSGINKCKEKASKHVTPTAAAFQKINEGIHRAFFLDLTAMTIRKKFLLHNDRGLPAIFRSDNVDYPWYLKEDAAELYIKWWSKDTDPGLFRGIKLGRAKNSKIGRDSAADTLDPKYAGRRHGNFFGNGHLRNGQWWPTQLCAVRDGAHSATIAGICGKSGEGAFSCVMSGGSYPNIDRGNEVWYYGTESDDPTCPTDSTRHLIENSKSHQPVRLLRAAKMNTEGANDYRPAEGMRYDGLYEVVGYEIKNLAKQVHLFRLVRLPDQGPIRNSGPEVRPTPEELAACAKAKMEKKYLA
ncbi:hypothetical protein E4T39_04667 [Aureobasidium subglaciale]|nr:hypothetical protein E4T39_04667 [Aureobasidium subglaciale]